MTHLNIQATQTHRKEEFNNSGEHFFHTKLSTPIGGTEHTLQ